MRKDNMAVIWNGILEQRLEYTPDALVSSLHMSPGRPEIKPVEFSFRLSKASPNERPEGIVRGETGVSQKDVMQGQTDALHIEQKMPNRHQQVEWIDAVEVSSDNYGTMFDFVAATVCPCDGETALVLKWRSKADTEYAGLELDVTYVACEGYPAVRKRIGLKNSSASWIRIDSLEMMRFAADAYPSIIHLTPAAQGLDPSIIAFCDTSVSRGWILASEIPSMLRVFSDDGVIAYRPDFWEQLLGPGESFETEPVILYAFSGESFPTPSAMSTALDRCVEKEFRQFLKKRILRPVDESQEIAPLFCTWTNYNSNIHDGNMYEAVDIASEIGFKCFQLDAGWSDAGPSGGWASSSIYPDTAKFCDLHGLSEYIRSKNMRLGLWYSVFRNTATYGTRQSALFSLPKVERAGGLGLSFACEESREQYVSDIVYLNKIYAATYFKQDLSNICFGDMAEGHESRTLKESYLRGLRGLFRTQDSIHAAASGVFLQMSHEIYWLTPGPAADIAALQHADSYHISPNEYFGAGDRFTQVSPSWNMDMDSLNCKLMEGCFRARKLWYAHRALPLERIEVFGAAVTNYQRSLTLDIQDRQICSWLMGAPLSFSGDLSALTRENIGRYRDRFAKLRHLQRKYGIYSCFQYSGVPAPTDEDWHWWGKLNDGGYGVVVVLRGRGGENCQRINIPWVQPDRKYTVAYLFSEGKVSTFTGKELQDGNITLALPPCGQEIIVVSEFPAVDG
jgi:hypothetical protein